MWGNNLYTEGIFLFILSNADTAIEIITSKLGFSLGYNYIIWKSIQGLINIKMILNKNVMK